MPITFQIWNLILLEIILYGAYVLATLGHVKPHKYIIHTLVISGWTIGGLGFLSYLGVTIISWE